MSENVMAEIAATAPGVQPLHAHAGAVLFRPNDPCRGFIAVRSGVIKVALTSAGGREIVLYRVRPREVCLQTFSCLVQDLPYAAEGAAETEIDALLIPSAAFERLIAEDPHFRAAVLNSVASRFADFEHVVETLAFTGLEARVAAALVRMAGEDSVVRVTHEALAAEVGSAREAVSRQLGLFARDGLVVLGRGRIEVLARDALSRRAGRPV